jgi:hypothetical protein
MGLVAWRGPFVAEAQKNHERLSVRNSVFCRSVSNVSGRHLLYGHQIVDQPRFEPCRAGPLIEEAAVPAMASGRDSEV